MRKKLALLIAVVFFMEIGCVSYPLPRLIILGEDFPPEVKLSAIVAGICLGILLLIKENSSPLE
jgi:hypothetical protein